MPQRVSSAQPLVLYVPEQSVVSDQRYAHPHSFKFSLPSFSLGYQFPKVSFLTLDSSFSASFVASSDGSLNGHILEGLLF